MKLPSSQRLSVRQGFPTVFLAWLVPAVLMVSIFGSQVWSNGPSQTDDLMRLVQIRDLLAGQSWFDVTQLRMGGPAGTEMHWSRLVDAPIAAMIWLGSQVLPQAQAEGIALLVWPLALLFFLMCAMAGLAGRLFGQAGLLTAMAYSAVAVSAIAYFAPGRLDHHNLQMVLLMSMLALVICSQRSPRYAIGAGFCAAASLAVGLETLPYIAITGFWLSIRWIEAYGEPGEKIIDVFRNFGFAFAGGAGMFYLLTVPAADFTDAQCDAFSLTYLGPAVLVGTGFAALSVWTVEFQRSRFKLYGLIALAAATAAAVLGINPTCYAGFYGEVNNPIVMLWLHYVEEAKGFPALFAQNPGLAYGLIAAPVIGLVGGCLASSRDEAFKLEWRLLTAILFLATLTAMIQMRAAPFANLLAVLPCAWLTLEAGRIFQARQPVVLNGAVFVVVWLMGMNATHTMIGQHVLAPALARADETATSSTTVLASCMAPRNYEMLAALPKGRIFNEIDLGPAILAHTHHSVVSGPYHRVTQGIQNSIIGFMAQPHNVRDAAWMTGSDYIAVCANGGQARLSRNSADGLMQRLVQGRIPDWLDRVPGEPGSPLLVFRIRHQDVGSGLQTVPAPASGLARKVE